MFNLLILMIISIIAFWLWHSVRFLIKHIISIYDKIYYYADKLNYALEEIGKIKKELKKIGVIK